MIEQASLVIGEGNWAVKSDSLLGYKINDGKYYPREMSVVRATTGTRINEDGLVEEALSNIARIDYSSGSAALLVEPQRTNLLTYSSSFDNAAWTKLLSSVTANAAISPSGNTDAYKLVESTGTGAHRCGRTSGSVNGTFSFYAKSGERTKIAILSTIIDVGFDLSNGTLIDLGSGTTNATITSVGNGWYRCSLYQATGISGVYFALLNSSGNFSYTGDGTSGAYFWGAQIENASYATSYIPTTSASVTRNADVISKTGISSLIGQTEGTLFAEINFKNLDKVPQQIMELHQDANNRLGLAAFWDSFLNENRVQLYQFFGGDLQVNIQDTLTTGILKIACAYKQNDYALYINGQQIGIDTSASVPTTSILYLGSNGSTFFVGNGMNSAALWKTRLTNDELERLTTI